METFLTDYGLEWVGGTGRTRADSPITPNRESPSNGFTLDLERLRKAIKALNQLAGNILSAYHE